MVDDAWALGQTKARDDTLLRIGATDTLDQAPLVLKVFDEADSLASAHTELVVAGWLEGSRDDHEHWERLW